MSFRVPWTFPWFSTFHSDVQRVPGIRRIVVKALEMLMWFPGSLRKSSGSIKWSRCPELGSMSSQLRSVAHEKVYGVFKDKSVVVQCPRSLERRSGGLLRRFQSYIRRFSSSSRVSLRSLRTTVLEVQRYLEMFWRFLTYKNGFIKPLRNFSGSPSSRPLKGFQIALMLGKNLWDSFRDPWSGSGGAKEGFRDDNEPSRSGWPSKVLWGGSVWKCPFWRCLGPLEEGPEVP